MAIKRLRSKIDLTLYKVSRSEKFLYILPSLPIVHPHKPKSSCHYGKYVVTTDNKQVVTIHKL